MYLTMSDVDYQPRWTIETQGVEVTDAPTEPPPGFDDETLVTDMAAVMQQADSAQLRLMAIEFGEMGMPCLAAQVLRMAEGQSAY